MELTSKDVHSVTFRAPKKSGTYVAADVDDFLDKIAESLDTLHAQLSAAKIKVSELEQQLAAAAAAPPQVAQQASGPASGSIDDIGRALLAAQRTADQMKLDASNEAQRIVDDARKEANKVIKSAEGDAREQASALQATKTALKQDVEKLEAYLNSERATLKARLQDLMAEVDKGIQLKAQQPSVRDVTIPSAVDISQQSTSNVVESSNNSPNSARNASQQQPVDITTSSTDTAPTSTGEASIASDPKSNVSNTGLAGNSGTSGPMSRHGADSASPMPYGLNNGNRAATPVNPAVQSSPGAPKISSTQSNPSPQSNLGLSLGNASSSALIQSGTEINQMGINHQGNAEPVTSTPNPVAAEAEINLAVMVDQTQEVPMALDSPQGYVKPVVTMTGEVAAELPSMQLYLQNLRNLNDDDVAASDPTGEVFERSVEEEERRLRQMTGSKRFARRRRGH